MAVTAAQRKALEFLGEHGSASMGTATGLAEGRLSIHFATVAVLVRQGFIARGPVGLALTDKGKRRVGILKESQGQRRARQAAEALAAQESGEWRPAPAGASAAADREAAEARREWAGLVSEVHSCRESAQWEREFIAITREWEPDVDVSESERLVERYEADADRAQAKLDELKRKGS